ncbi:hypothetical protein AKJ57_05015 [candidate division MSBL1 archaeon SCGC-AAA259A05]|uniref:Uncharacterized protein n=1 Tax=candidate division MSBL1 archaeon SCGC-AAA259A05 TaxID=1698259 RepID=A0A133U664_9EURY|nr:hypothetical protein AKJ57_05015 [candidate division MSBL1 archaeon SCGC-AAA259A05]
MGGGRVEFSDWGRQIRLLEQHEIFLARERERLEVEIAASLKKPPAFSPELGVGLPPGVGVAKPCRGGEKFKDSELGGAKVDDHPKEKGGENNRRRV